MRHINIVHSFDEPKLHGNSSLYTDDLKKEWDWYYYIVCREFIGKNL